MSDIKKVALYSRVSTKNQDLKRQKEKLINYAESRGWDWDLYAEKVSSVADRPELEKIFDSLDEYDGLIVTKLDRLARSVQDLLSRKEILNDSDVDFITTDQEFNDSTAEGELLINVLGSVAEFERQIIRERLREGYDKALEDGKVGRPRKISGKALDDFRTWWDKGHTPKVIQALLDTKHDIEVSNDTIYRTAEREGLR